MLLSDERRSSKPRFHRELDPDLLLVTLYPTAPFLLWDLGRHSIPISTSWWP